MPRQYQFHIQILTIAGLLIDGNILPFAYLEPNGSLFGDCAWDIGFRPLPLGEIQVEGPPKASHYLSHRA